jgi:hypothetical protein
VRVYRVPMRFSRADLAASVILTVLVCVLGTGLGVAASRVRAGGAQQHGPLRIILHAGFDTPSIQRDRVRLRRAR